ncbi:MAG: hypothetical protein Q4B28_05180 [bacterium]|nr:hypothetical protein [bacterium]
MADQFPLLSSNAEAREYLQSDIEKISNQEKTMEELLSVYSKHFPGYLSEE